MLTLADYWMGRDAQYPHEMSLGLERNALLIVELANKLVTLAKVAGVTFRESPKTGTLVSSGWRPASLNAKTANAAPNSKHITGQAIDLYDQANSLDSWLMTKDGQDTMVKLGLWHEHPTHTPGWVHVQSIPPRSGKRTFYP